jgi:hypothetical protein
MGRHLRPVGGKNGLRPPTNREVVQRIIHMTSNEMTDMTDAVAASKSIEDTAKALGDMLGVLVASIEGLATVVERMLAQQEEASS